MPKEIDSLDIDGLLVTRPVPIQGGSLARYAKEGVAMYDRTLIIPDNVDRTVNTRPISSVKEAVSYYFHRNRGLKPGVLEFIMKRESVKFGNTGRKNRPQWINLTWEQLNSQGVDDIEDIYFTPPGMENLISKGAALNSLREHYTSITHYDDDPYTLLLLAQHFPDIRFVLVEDSSTALLLSHVDLSEYPNVTVIQDLRDIL